MSAKAAMNLLSFFISTTRVPKVKNVFDREREYCEIFLTYSFTCLAFIEKNGIKCKVIFPKALLFGNRELLCPAFTLNHYNAHNALKSLDEKDGDEDHLEGPVGES